MSEREDEELERSTRVDNWGFAVTLATSSQVSVDGVMYATVPAWMTRRWVINLNQWRYTGGTLPSGALFPPSAQTAERIVRLRLEYGSAEAMETVEVDYPRNGCSFGFPASTFRVSVFAASSPVGAAQPLLTGFVAPCGLSRGAGGLVHHPTYTAVGAVLVVTAVAFVPVPARAVAYRILYPSTLPVDAGQLLVTQQSSQFNILATDSGVAGQPGEPALGAVARAAYYPLVQQCAYVAIDNGGPGTTAVVVQFMLDLG